MTAASWAPVAELCMRVKADLPRLARDSVRSIRRDLPPYAAVSLEEHLAAVTNQQQRRLQALAEHRGLTDDDLGGVAELARRRARQGIPVDVVIGAYHLGDQVLWEVLRQEPGPAAPLLPEVASLMLRLLHAISTVVASAHADVTRDLQSHRVTLSQRLLDIITAGTVGAEAAHLAEALGLDPQADFVAAVWRRPEPAVILPPEVRRGLETGSVPLVHSADTGMIVVLGQGVDAQWFVGLAARLHFDGQVGIGLRRSGLQGAALSVGDARLAVTATSGNRRVLSFADMWPEACLSAEAARLDPLLAQASGVASKHPHLASTVLAYVAADMSIIRTAEDMHLHPNSVTYRLQRWEQLTGWNPRSFDGLIKSRAACRQASGETLN